MYIYVMAEESVFSGSSDVVELPKLMPARRQKTMRNGGAMNVKFRYCRNDKSIMNKNYEKNSTGSVMFMEPKTGSFMNVPLTLQFRILKYVAYMKKYNYKSHPAKCLFGTDKPYRRKSQPDAADGSTQTTKKLRLWIDSSAAEKETINEAKVSDVEHFDARKRKGDKEIIAENPSSSSSDEEFIPRKRKKLLEEAEVDGLFESDLQMGKKSKDPRENKEEAVKSHFGTDKPLCRKPQPDAADGDAGGRPTKKLRVRIDSSASEKETKDKVSDVEHSDARKRRRDREITAEAAIPPSSEEESIPRKRKKLVEEGKVDGLNKINKRKRDEIELEYEKRKFGSVGEDEPAATVVAVGEKRKAAAAAADMLDAKESFDDESKLLRTAFVGNLPMKTKMKALNREFARFGEIESVRIRSMPLVDIKAPRKAAVIKGQINEEADSMNAYIVFKEEQSAHAALSNNMTQIGGNHIRVDMACPPRKKMKVDAHLYDKKRTQKK